MAITQNTFTGNGSNLGPFTFTFKWLESTDVKVTVNGVLKTAGTHYNLQALNYTTKDGGQVLFTAGNAPAANTVIRIYRDTDDSALPATFFSGSAIRSQDLNDDFTQNLYSTQEVKARYLDRQSGEMEAVYVPSTSTSVVTKGYMETNYGIIDEVGFTRWRQVATSGQTAFSGAGSYGNILSFVPTREQVYLNGALQQINVDYTTNTAGTTITFSPSLTAGDVVDVVCINNLVQNSTTNSDDLDFVQAGTGAVTRSVGSKLRDVVSVKDFGAIGDGVTDDTAAIQAAVTAASGRTLLFPSGTYLLSSNISKPPLGVNTIFDPGARVSGTGRMFASTANLYHDYNGTFFYRDIQLAGVAGRGDSALSADFTSSDSYLGNGCAGFFSTTTPANAVGYYWAINPILQLNPGLTGNGIACEIDLDNFTADGKGQGCLISGIGTFNPQVGLLVQYEGNKDWQTGINVKRSQTGIIVSGSNVVSPVYGQVIENYPSNLLKLRPSSASVGTDTCFYVANPTDTAVNYAVTNRGGIKIGENGSEITSSKSYTVSFNSGLLAPLQTLDYTVTLTGASLSTSSEVTATPYGTPAAGITWQTAISGANTIAIRLINHNTVNTDPDGGAGLVWRIVVNNYA